MCASCGYVEWHDIDIKVFDYRIFLEREAAHRYLIKTINIKDTISDKEMKEKIVKTFRELKEDPVDAAHLNSAIISYFGIAESYSKDLTEYLLKTWDD